MGGCIGKLKKRDPSQATETISGADNSTTVVTRTRGRPGKNTEAQTNKKQTEEFKEVVGASSAGSVVANRLSDKWSVLLLEAGEEPTPTTQIPALVFSLQETKETWKYEPETQEFACQGFSNQRCKCYSGKARGGSSSVNVMLYVRGLPFDYDRWEEAGNPGWGWTDVMHYYKKSEDNTDFRDNPEYHGTGGELKVTHYGYDIPAKQRILEAAAELGVPTVEDIHNGTDICFGDNGQRHGTYQAFLQPARDRGILKVITGAYVTKVIIDPRTRVAQAVEVKVKDEVKRFRARKEIELSAGALKTPHILMLSGVGPRHHLEELGLPVVQDLREGENLQDHMFFLGMYIKLPEELIPPDNLMDTSYEYFMHRSGKLATVRITNFVGFINTLKVSPIPDVQFMHIGFSKNVWYVLPFFLRVSGMSEEIQASVLEANKHSALFMYVPILIRPKSIGYLRLASSDPFAKPRMVSNYLKDPQDVEIPDMQLIHSIFPKNNWYGLPLILRVTGMSEEIQASVLEANKHSDLVVSWPLNLRPKSIGYLRLASSDPFAKPRMVSNYLKDSQDVEIPDIQLIHSVFPKNNWYGLPLILRVTGMSEEIQASVLEANKHSALVVSWPLNLRPKSIGYLRLASSDHFAKPRMVSNYLKDPQDVEIPDIQLIHSVFPKNNWYGLPLILRVTGMSEEIQASVLEANKHSALVVSWPLNLRPKSIGYLRLASSDPFAKPRLVSNCLKDPQDVETLLRGTKFVEDIFKTKTFEKHNPEFLDFDHPICKQHEFQTSQDRRLKRRNACRRKKAKGVLGGQPTKCRTGRRNRDS